MAAMARLRTVFLGGFVSGALSLVLAPRVRRSQRLRGVPFLRDVEPGPAAFGGTPCSRREADSPQAPAGAARD
jgi:hypothetical protein